MKKDKKALRQEYSIYNLWRRGLRYLSASRMGQETDFSVFSYNHQAFHNRKSFNFLLHLVAQEEVAANFSANEWEDGVSVVCPYIGDDTKIMFIIIVI